MPPDQSQPIRAQIHLVRMLLEHTCYMNINLDKVGIFFAIWFYHVPIQNFHQEELAHWCADLQLLGDGGGKFSTQSSFLTVFFDGVTATCFSFGGMLSMAPLFSSSLLSTSSSLLSMSSSLLSTYSSTSLSRSSSLSSSVSASKVSASTNLVREYARKRKNSKRLTSLLYPCTVKILCELKSVCNSSVVLAEVCGCTILPAMFFSDGLDELWGNVVNVNFPLCNKTSKFVVV
jgi:hypothetical protein